MSAGAKVMAVLVMVAAVLMGSLVLHSQQLTAEQRRLHEAKPIWERMQESVTAVGSGLAKSIREGIEARKQAQPTAKIAVPPTAQQMRADLKKDVKVTVDNAARDTLEKADEVRCATCEKVDEARQAGTPHSQPQPHCSLPSYALPWC
jgi:hypothetical protein